MGCKIPADMRMIEMLTSQLRVDQAILTGIFFRKNIFHLISHVTNHKLTGTFRYILFRF